MAHLADDAIVDWKLGVRKINTYKLGAFGTAILLAMASSTSAAVLDFESFGAGLIIDDEYAPDVLVSATNFGNGPDLAIIFDTTDPDPAGGDFDLVGPFNSNNAGLADEYSPGNVLIIQERNNCDPVSCAIPDDEGARPGGEFEFLFSSDIILETIDFFDIEDEEDNGSPDSQIHLFDADDDEIQAGMWFVPATGGDNLWNQLDFESVSGVRRIVIEMGGSGAIDNLTYQIVPLPATLWLFGSALGLLGWARSRSLRSVTD